MPSIALPMSSCRIGKILITTLLSLTLFSGCECDTACDERVAGDNGPRDDSGGENPDENGAGGGGTGTADDINMDCSQLDPDAVYLVGTLQEGAGDRRALIDPTNPEAICTGFPDGIASGPLTDMGHLIYVHHDNNVTADGGAAYRFVQDPLTLDNEGLEWRYPLQPNSNDEALLFSESEQLFVHNDPDSASIDVFQSKLLSLDKVVYRNSEEEPYYRLERFDVFDSQVYMLGVTPDGSLLMGDSQTGLILVDSDKQLTRLTPAGTPPYRFKETSRLYIDPVTGNQSVWVVLEDFNGPDTRSDWRRWSLDLATLTVTNEGLFAASPQEINRETDEIKLGADGTLWQISYSPLDSNDDLTSYLIRRPTVASGESSEVIYSDAYNPDDTLSWTRQARPFVRIDLSGELVSGQ
ncbi:hypothetical protein [Marinimicrobium sp. LS-A18]|uniref:hypothetical protein n=1 Tax=Marinimicrobium sp. LS-A18 TaxID=1381596 RepID=UPI00046384FD|nr:hypothetical protein [Marinimicrobium sp. LS-A18]